MVVVQLSQHDSCPAGQIDQEKEEKDPVRPEIDSVSSGKKEHRANEFREKKEQR